MIFTKDSIKSLMKIAEWDVYVNFTNKDGKLETITCQQFLDRIKDIPNLTFMAQQIRNPISIYQSASSWGTIDDNGMVVINDGIK